MDQEDYKPFFVECALSGKSTCQICSKNILFGELRIAIMTCSTGDDGIYPTWYHAECFFPMNPQQYKNGLPHPTSTDEIEGFDQLFRSSYCQEGNWLKGEVAKVSNGCSKKLPNITWNDVSVSKKIDRAMKITMKDELVIDSHAIWSGYYLIENCHVYKESGFSFTKTLCQVHLDAGYNSYYKLQVLESDDFPRRYFLFRSWGRIGEFHLGKHLCDEMDSKESAVNVFNFILEERTNPNLNYKYKTMELDFGKVTITSNEPYIKLEPQLDKFIRKIFQIGPDPFLVEFNIDSKRMPLGKLSMDQMWEAYLILNAMTKLVDQNEDEVKDEIKVHNRLVQLTNEYLTLVPRRFSRDSPPLWNTCRDVQIEVERLEDLMDVELTLEFSPRQPTMYTLYKSLASDIVVVDRNTEIFEVLEKYLNNTHIDHSQVTIQLDNIYSIARHGENELFSKSKDVGNRKLLWHGTSTANIKGIFSTGLGLPDSYQRYTGNAANDSSSRTAVFFSDMASKSAWYCKFSRQNNTGALLLSEVALGELAGSGRSYAGQSSKKPGTTYNFIQGSCFPDPNDYWTLPSGCIIPYGKPTSHSREDKRYNEYIVFDKAQVNLQFLLEVTFNFK